MKVLVRIDVIEWQAGRGEGCELRLDLRCELPPRLGPRENLKTKPRHAGAKPAGAVDQIWHLLSRQRRPAIDQHDMEPDPQPRQAARSLNRIRRRGARDHHTCCCQDTVAMRNFDGLVDLRRQPEIVSRDDEALQSAASRRSRRNWKNSTPSRKRRFIICGERTISPTMAAIFGTRK
jgi:hypothetical protein